MSNNENDNNPAIYYLKQSKDLEDSGLFKYATRNRVTDIIEVFVNHKINGPINWTLNRKTWTKNFEMFWQQMNEYGIIDDKTKLLCRKLLAFNQEGILKPYSKSKKGGKEEDDDIEGAGGGGISGGKITNQDIAGMLIGIAEDYGTLFNDEFGVPRALLKIDNNHHEVLSVEGKKFERYLAKLFYEQFYTVATAEGLNSAIRTLAAKAIFDCETIPLHLRIAWTNPQVKDSIYYDLTDKNRRYIKITNGQVGKLYRIRLIFCLRDSDTKPHRLNRCKITVPVHLIHLSIH